MEVIIACCILCVTLHDIIVTWYRELVSKCVGYMLFAAVARSAIATNGVPATNNNTTGTLNATTWKHNMGK